MLYLGSIAEDSSINQPDAIFPPVSHPPSVEQVDPDEHEVFFDLDKPDERLPGLEGSACCCIGPFKGKARTSYKGRLGRSLDL